ncbi:MAG: DUF433 domain-containing protein [Pseudomonadota bacterium]
MQNILAQGFYTIKEAASLIALDVIGVTHSSLRRAFSETKRYEAAVESTRAYDGKVTDISFNDLLELRFIAYFKNKGVTSQAIRKAAETARQEFGPHPFARRDVVFKQEGRKIFSEAAEETGDKRFLDLIQKQYAFELVQDFFDQGVEWSASQYAEYWQPKKTAFPSIVIDPRVSFGRPSIINRGLAVDTVFDALEAEDGDYDAVANWFEIDPQLVREAVQFRDELPV